MGLKLFAFAELDSTSTKAQALLDSGAATAPFAVRADRQTAGRGRRGTHWDSAAGNLYLTVVLAPTDFAEQALAPLKAAALVVAYVAQATGLQLTLKWPNDLLFAGKKVGGLLLETSLRGTAQGAVLVGIGLNLASAPELTGDARAVSLRAISGDRLAAEALDPQKMGEGLAQHLIENWPRLPRAEIGKAFEASAIARGSLWQAYDDATQFRRDDGLDEDGALRLLPVTVDAPVERLTSVDHRYHWVYQGSHAEDHPLLLADVGNTRTKLACLAPAAAAMGASTGSYADADSDALAASLAQFAAAMPARGWPVHALSVNPRRLAHLVELAAGCGLRVVPLPKRPVRRQGAQYPLAELGIDRLALIEAWLADFAFPGGLGLIVSAGTATTFDVVRADGRHLGGLIIAGLQTSVDALHAGTGLLPQLDLHRDQPTTALGDGTRAAMVNGSLLATVGAVEHLLRRYHDAGESVELVLTGGFATMLAAHVPRARVVQDLVLRGAQVMALGGSMRSGGR